MSTLALAGIDASEISHNLSASHHNQIAHCAPEDSASQFEASYRVTHHFGKSGSSDASRSAQEAPVRCLLQESNVVYITSNNCSKLQPS